MIHATQIRDRLWIGSHQAYDEVANGNPDNITAILNVAMDYVPKHTIHPHNVKYAKINLGDGLDNPQEQIDLAVLVGYIYYTNGNNLLIHCISGVSRSPHIATKILLRDDFLFGATYDSIYQEIKYKRPEVQVPSFMDARPESLKIRMLNEV